MVNLSTQGRTIVDYFETGADILNLLDLLYIRKLIYKL